MVAVSPILPPLEQLFQYELDPFQQEAIQALSQGESVVVCAPTGSGKTAVAEYAVYRAIYGQGRVFYTTPLKALSNQKYRDFCGQFGPDRVGLLTGDLSLNREAPVVVMTTEIFRNMLYGLGEADSLQGLQTVILDECHYMNDSQRGTVWEESIIYAPPQVQLAALSATIENAGQLADWIDQVHGPTRLIYSDYRPVPLTFHFCSPKGLFPLLDAEGKKINPRIAQGELRRIPQKRNPQMEAPPLTAVVSHLARRDMLPAIYFIFSRRGCDDAVASMDGVDLLQPEEAEKLKDQIDAFVRDNSTAVRDRQLANLYQGIASHHAGVLPAWKALVEQLFQQGLIKVVFATETLAAGINMPARTTVIASLSKRTDNGHRLLNASEFLQMAGRAGRRGMDPVGYVVTLQSPFESAKEAARLATAKADPLVSQFTPSYGMVLNLLERHSLDDARSLIERSFGQYLSTLHLAPIREEYDELHERLAQLSDKIPVSPETLEHYQKLRGSLREARRLLTLLEGQASKQRTKELIPLLLRASMGTLLLVQDEARQLQSAVLVKRVESSGQPILTCLTLDNRWLVLGAHGVHHLSKQQIETAGLMPPPIAPRPGLYQAGGAESQTLADLIPPLTAPAPAPELEHQRAVVDMLNEQVRANPAHVLKPAQIEKQAHEQARLRKKLHRLEQELGDTKSQGAHANPGYYWEEFLRLVRVLQDLNFIDTRYAPTNRGQQAAALRGDNELWLALALMDIQSKFSSSLSASLLAQLCCALVSEPPRPNSWTNYPPSSEMEEILGSLREVRRMVQRSQRKHKVFLPLWLEPALVGLVEQWSKGASWQELCAATSLDEGDLVRVLRRTLDVLRQIPHVPYLEATLKDKASDAQRMLDRFPVNEVL